MVDIGVAIAVVMVAVNAAVVIAGILYAGKYLADPDPVLMPVDHDEADRAGANFALVATIQYDATGNTERLVILDPDELKTWEAKKVIQNQMMGADVRRIDRLKLYRKGPGWQDAIDQDDDE